MAVVSIRFAEEPVRERLREAARRHRVSLSSLAERLIDEGLRTEAHPMVVFRSGPGGRRPVLVGGPDLIDVIGAMVGGDVPADERRTRAAELLELPLRTVDAAWAYYAEFTEEVDALLAERARGADEAEAAWRRQRALLER